MGNGVQDLHKEFKEMSNALRFLCVDAIEKAKSGHPGKPLGCADIITVLFAKHMNFYVKDPLWFDRDRFVLSPGHASMVLYALGYVLGYEDIALQDIMNFRQISSKAAGHPEHHLLSFVECTTGPLGQGLGNAVGFALAQAHLQARFGEEISSHYTYVLVGDGCLMEGISYEAVALAGRLKLHKLIVLWDNNGITIDGDVSLVSVENQKDRFRANGWNVLEADGHDYEGIDHALNEAKKSHEPTFIAFLTVIGKGSPKKEGLNQCHGSPLGVQEIKDMRVALDWPHDAFTLPESVLEAWRKIGLKSLKTYDAWNAKVLLHTEFQAYVKRDFEGVFERLVTLKKELWDRPEHVSTRRANQRVLETILPLTETILGGSADLTASNLTWIDGLEILNSENYAGRYIHYGVREHAMGAIMNGLALYGLLPYGGTFLVFSDYLKPALRLSALMKQCMLYIFTHDSIGVGEDGPTHQPIEHLMALRNIPNVQVFRPADIFETIEAWELVLKKTDGPSVLVLSRQDTLVVRSLHTVKNKVSRGAYMVYGEYIRDISLFSSGTEVALAVAVGRSFKQKGIQVSVISVPCMELFFAQDQEYQNVILGLPDHRCVSIEAGSTLGWERFVGRNGLKIGIDRFGISGKPKDVYDALGFTCEKIVQQIEKYFGI